MKLADLLKDHERAITETVRYEFSEDDYLVLADKEHCLKGQWIDLFPSGSKEYQDHMLSVDRKYAGMKGEFSPLEKENQTIAGLIKAWSFSDEPTTDNKVAALKLFPLTLKVDILNKANTVNFTKRKAKNSENTTSAKSG